MTSRDLVSVIVPVRDDPEGVQRLLERLVSQTIDPDRFEVIIGDDGSEAGSMCGFERDHDRVRVVTGPPETSYAARNLAARAARGSVLAFCDSDCLPDSDWLERGLEALAHADVVAGEVRFDPPERPTVWSLLTMDMFLDQGRNVLLSTAVTANLFVRRALFERLGGFDASLPSGGDYDFTRRAVAQGAELAHGPDAIVHHPTLDRWRPFLRKVWFTNRWSAVRKARSGLRPGVLALATFVPILGVALARRHAVRPLATLCRPRLVAAGLEPGWKEDLRAIPVLYGVVAYVAGLARVRGWLLGRRLPPDPGVTNARAQRAALSRGRTNGSRPARAGALPNLIVIGAQKCGTSALHYYLGLHPSISMSRPKEVNFFIEKRNWRRGVRWYARQFDATSPVRGEASPDYTAFPQVEGVPERMASVIPEARLVFIVRDPLDRIAAHWVHNYAKRRERGSLGETLLHPTASYTSRSRYHLQLQRFLEHFERDQILVLDSHALRHQRLHTLRRVFEFVGVDPGFYHPGFDRVRHRTDRKRRSTRLGLRMLELSRTRVGRAVPHAVWRGLDRALSLSRPIGPHPDVREALGAEVVELLREDADRLREVTGLGFGHWSV